MEPDWERTASGKLGRYGYVVISCANFSSRAGYFNEHPIYPNFVRRRGANRLHLCMRSPGGVPRVLGRLDLAADAEITGDRFKIIPRHSHAGHRVDILVVCGWWEANRWLPDMGQRMQSGGLLKYMFLSDSLFISEYSINPRTHSHQEVQLGIVAGRLLHEDYQLGTMWFNHDGEFHPQDFLLLKAQREGYRGVLAVPVIARLEGTERVMPPDVSRFEVISADGADDVSALNAEA